MKKKISNLKSFKSIYDIQQALYRDVYDFIANGDFIHNLEIKSYADQFYDSIPSFYTETNLDNILKEINSSQLTLVGDFHTLRQNQKGFIKLIQKYKEKHPNKKVSIALETFKTKDQSYVDQFMNNEIDEFEFLNKIQYRKSWGFSWNSYAKILSYAKKEHIDVIAINSKSDLNNSLYLRDKIAAHTVNQRALNNRDEKIFVLIGEYHLAPSHLPKFLKFSYTRILFNLDNAFFSNLEFYQQDSEYIKLDNGLFGVINTPSWIKWATFSIWEEQQQSKDNYFSLNPEDEYTEDHVDLDYQLLSISKTFCKIIKLEIPSYKLSNFTTIDTFYHSDVEDLIQNLYIETFPCSYIKHRLEVEGFYYNFDNSIFLIKEVTPNNLGECMGQLLFKTIYYHNPEKKHDRFIFRLLLSISGCITSLILNPKRRTSSLKHAYSLNPINHAVECYKWILNQHKPAYIPEAFILNDIESNGDTTHVIGQLIGRNIFMSILENDDVDFNDLDIFKSDEEDLSKILFKLIRKFHL